jgi:hypothetical protein
MMDEIAQVLYHASQNKLMCRIQMQGEFLSRVIHPYGICKTAGNKVMLICWQSLGFTSSKGQPGYRNLSLENCQSVEIMDTHFVVDANFNPADAQYKEWIYHI